MLSPKRPGVELRWGVVRGQRTLIPRWDEMKRRERPIWTRALCPVKSRRRCQVQARHSINGSFSATSRRTENALAAMSVRCLPMPLSILVLLLLSTSFASADAQVRPLPAEVSTVPLFSQLIDVRVAGEPGSNGRSVRDDRTDAASEQSFQYLIAAKEPADRSTPLLLEALQVTAEPQNPNRLSNIQVDGSDDLISWSTLASGVPLLSFESEGKLLAARNVELSGGHYRFLRLSLTPAQGFKNVSVSGRPGRPQLRAAEVASRILYVVALLGIVVGGMPWKFRSQSKGGPLHRHDAILSSGVTRLSGLVVLVLLYHGLILTDWHVIEDIRAMVVPS